MLSLNETAKACIYLFTYIYIFFNVYLFSILLIFYFVYNRDNRRI